MLFLIPSSSPGASFALSMRAAMTTFTSPGASSWIRRAFKTCGLPNAAPPLPTFPEHFRCYGTLTTVKPMKFSMYEHVRLEIDLPEQLLQAGAVGIVIEINGPDHYEVDFGDEEGSVSSSDLTKVPSSDKSTETTR